MFWTLILVLLVGLGVGATFLHKIMILDPKKHVIIPPSYALIDQWLPTVCL
jgi:hypothetical protein